MTRLGALGGTRTPNLLIRSQMLYPLSYERRRTPHSVRHLQGDLPAVPAVLLTLVAEIPSVAGDHGRAGTRSTERTSP